MLSDTQGIPLAVAVSGANIHDSLALKPLIRGIPAVRSRRGPRRDQPVKLRAARRTSPPNTWHGCASAGSSRASRGPASSSANAFQLTSPSAWQQRGTGVPPGAAHQRRCRCTGCLEGRGGTVSVVYGPGGRLGMELGLCPRTARRTPGWCKPSCIRPRRRCAPPAAGSGTRQDRAGTVEGLVQGRAGSAGGHGTTFHWPASSHRRQLTKYNLSGVADTIGRHSGEPGLQFLNYQDQPVPW